MVTLDHMRKLLEEAIRQLDAEAVPEFTGMLEAAKVSCLARLLAPPSPTAVDTLLDADHLAQRTGVPATWWRDAARRGLVPHIRAGSYVRFSFDAVTVALANQPVMRRQRRAPHRIARPAKAKNTRSRKDPLPHCYRADGDAEGE